jgi:hypothetical protein
VSSTFTGVRMWFTFGWCPYIAITQLPHLASPSSVSLEIRPHTCAEHRSSPPQHAVSRVEKPFQSQIVINIIAQMAERSKALVSGTSSKERRFESCSE